MTRPGTARRAFGITAGLMALWAAGVTWVAPAVIRGAHSGRIPLLGRLFSGRATQPVDGYLAAWEPIARSSVVIVWTTALLVLAAVLLRQHARRLVATPQTSTPTPASAGQLLLVAAWVGIGAGLGEAWYYVSRVFYQGKESAEVFGISQHAVWMSPLANLVAFLLAGGVLLLVRRAGVRRLDPRTIVIALAWLAAFILVMVTGRLHWAAAAVLTLGLAVQIGRTITPGAGEVAGLARRSVAWLAAFVLGLGLLVPVLDGFRGRRQLDTAGTPAPDAPNVLFIVLDTQRAASTGLHGAVRPTTPFLDQFAREGVWFERAIAPSSWTLPSHAAMFTGRPIDDLRVGWSTPLDDRLPTLAEALAERGYATAGFVANNKYLSDVYGLGRGFGVWRDQAILPGTFIVHSWLARTLAESARHRLGIYQLLRRKTADRVNTEFLDWLDGSDQRPFFAFLNFYDPHMPYLPPAPWNLRFSDTQPFYWIDGERPDSSYTPVETAELLAAYESSIAYLDNRLEALFGSLRERGRLENTLVVITSDHGEEFGEDGSFEHGRHLTLAATHVPLVVRHPRAIPAGLRVTQPVGLRDLAATVLSLTGGPDPGIPGESLERYWQPSADSPAPRGVFSRDGNSAALVTDSFQLLRVRGREDRLFNHRLDPLGLHDLASDPGHAPIRAELGQAIRALIAARP